MTFISDVRKMAAGVISAHGLRDDVAQQAAGEIAAMIQRAYGGGDVYVHSIAVKERQTKIIDSLDGTPVHEVAKKLGVTKQTVYRVARKVRSKGIK